MRAWSWARYGGSEGWTARATRRGWRGSRGENRWEGGRRERRREAARQNEGCERPCGVGQKRREGWPRVSG